MRLWIALLFSVVASAQTAVWPGSAATDSQLLVGANLCQTRLSQPINDTTSTTIFVTNSSVTSPYCFVVNQEVQVDNEFMKVTSVGFGQMTVTRGFDYSTASTHQINAPVVNNVAAAWYHNALAKEIESIEAWLAAGGGGGGGGGVCGVNGSIQYNNLGACGGYAILPAAVLPAATNAAQGAVQLPTLGTSNVLGTTASGIQSSIAISVTQPPYNADPTGVADSTAAITAACNAAKILGGSGQFGSTLYFPAGKYLTDTITCLATGGSGMTFQGAGPLSTTLVSLSGNDLIDINNAAIENTITIKDIGLNGSAGSSNHGIYASGPGSNALFRLVIDNVTIQNVGGRCVYQPTQFSTTINNVQCKSLNDNGIEIAGENGSIISNSYVHQIGPGKAAYVIYSGATTMIADTGLDGSVANTTWGLFGQNTADGDPQINYAFVTLIGCNIEDFSQYGIRVKAGMVDLHSSDGFLSYVGTTTAAVLYEGPGFGVMDIGVGTTFTTFGTWLNGTPINATNACPAITTESWTSGITTCYSQSASFAYPLAVLSAANPAFHVQTVDISFFSSSHAYLTAPHLGTPHDAILTNATALPLSGLTSQAADTVVMNQTGGSAQPTAIGMPTGGTNGCAGGTNALIYNTTTHQLGCNTLNPYGAFSGWGAVTADFGGTATQYAPYIGGATTNGTETIVSLAASSTATISHLSVSLSAQIGASATLAVTLEDGTATPTALTCTTAAGGTTCVDNSHSVNVTQGDLLSFKLVAGGSVSAGTPKLTISYTIGVTSATIIQGGVASLIAPVVTSGSTENTIISAPVAANSVSAGTLYRINAVCLATSGAGSGTNRLYAHYGTTGTSSDTALGQLFGSSPTTGTAIGFIATMYVTFTSTTATTLTGGYVNSTFNTGAWPLSINYGFVANTTSLNTTVNKFLTLTAQSDGGTTVFTCNPGTSIEVVKP